MSKQLFLVLVFIVIGIIMIVMFVTACYQKPTVTSGIGSNSENSGQQDEKSYSVISEGESGVSSNVIKSSEDVQFVIAPDYTSDSISETASIPDIFDWGKMNTNDLILIYPSHGSSIEFGEIKFFWSDIGADSYDFTLEVSVDGDYKKLIEKSDISSCEWIVKDKIARGKTYRWKVTANINGETKGHYLDHSSGAYFFVPFAPEEHPSNLGKDFAFYENVSMEVLNNYLSRSITLSFISSPSVTSESDKTMILRTGAKYVGRSIIPWKAETDYSQTIDDYAAVINEMHEHDPEIVFEACIFETVWTDCNLVSIPEWVFLAFGQKPENRNFAYEKMLFDNGKYVDFWESGCSVPDITKLETQMYFYYRACRYIDAGFEGIHWGQVMLTGENDINNCCYNKVLSLIRAYAHINARRHFILNNAHTHGALNADGVLLFDFHAWPIRGVIPPGLKEHPPTESNPQIVELRTDDLDSIFCRSLGGVTVSGWSCDSLPYIVELDNGGGYREGCLNKPYIDYRNWGMDGISWYANQPDEYRHYWLEYAYNWVRENDSAGHFIMPGSRPIYDQRLNSMSWYHANSKVLCESGWGDEEAISSIWINNH